MIDSSSTSNPQPPTSNLQLLLGLDGGGSKTRALLADQIGNVLGVGIAASSNYQSVGFAAATAAVQAATAQALAAAGRGSDRRIAAAAFGLAGVDRPADRVLFDAWLAETKLADRTIVVNDAELVLAAGTPDGWGVALICGTGSISIGRSPDGRTARSGGWGHLIGDEGSGYGIGIAALRLAAQTADGRADAPGVLLAVLEHWSLRDPSDLIGHVYRSDMTRAEIAKLARVVVQLADAGDSDAQSLLDQAAIELARLIAAVSRQLDLQTSQIALGGGLIGATPRLQQALSLHSGIAIDRMHYVDDPARGALVLARRLFDAGGFEG